MAYKNLSESESSKQVRVAIYARVSTTSHGQDVTLQTRELEQFSKARAWQIIDLYVDVGVSGGKEKRPGLDKLLRDARGRRFDVLLCWKLDRVGRSLRHLVNLLADLEALGISFVSLSDNLDLTTPSGQLMFHVIAAMAQFERSLIQERVRAGLRNAVSKGRKLGRPRIAVDIAQIRRLRGQGRSVREIANALGYSRSLVHKTLVNRNIGIIANTAH
jgi:DNA invertase Pin-like site-specific DNA recombinase